MSEITVFAFDSSAVRSVMIDGEPWFVAADVISVLSLDRKALERLDDDEKGVNSIHTLGGAQEMTIVNESGLYSLILGSRKPEAKRFKKWVTAEVLPSIRKRGSYSAIGGTPHATLSHNPAHAADQFVAADRSFRAALRSARAAGLRTPRALVLAREVALAKSGLDMFAELAITPEDVVQSEAPAQSAAPQDPMVVALSGWVAQSVPWQRYKLADIVGQALGLSPSHPGHRCALLKAGPVLRALGMKSGLRRDAAGVKQRWWWLET